MLNTKRIAEYENFINGQEQIIQMLNRITQKHADMDVEEFMKMCNDTKKQLVALKEDRDLHKAMENTEEDAVYYPGLIHSDPVLKKTNCNISRAFQADALDCMDYNEGDEDYYH